MRNFILPIAALAILTFTGCTGGSGDGTVVGPDGEIYDESQLNPSEGPGSNPDPATYTGNSDVWIEYIGDQGEGYILVEVFIQAEGGPIAESPFGLAVTTADGQVTLYEHQATLTGLDTDEVYIDSYAIPLSDLGWDTEYGETVDRFFLFAHVWADGQPDDNWQGGYLDMADLQWNGYATGTTLRDYCNDTDDGTSTPITEPADPPPAPPITANG